MNFCSVPYEADFGGVDGGANKMMPMNMPQNGQMSNGGGGGMPMPMGPQMNLGQMQMPAMCPGPMSFPMQAGNCGGMPMGMPMGMMPTSSSMPMSTQLPLGSVTPLSSMTLMPMGAGSIDAPGINAVIPDLQSMSGMQQMGQMPQMNQYNQMHQGRLVGGSSAGTSGMAPTNWSPGQQTNQMWGYPQGNYGNMAYQQQQQHPQQQQQQSLQQQHHHHSQSQQHQQQMQQNQRMKNQYDSMNYRDVRNGLNSPSMQDSLKYSKSSHNHYNNSKNGKVVPQWR